MSDTKNHKKAIEVLRVARKIKGSLTDILLQIAADDPSKIVNAWGKVKPVRLDDSTVFGVCSKCHRVLSVSLMEGGVCFSCIGKKLP